MNDIQDIAQAMVQKGKGILAADESTPTCTKRFESINVESTAENRNAYRDMLFTADGIENHISGVILFDETIRQSTVNGSIPFPEHLAALGIIPGIKVDKGAKQLANSDDEKITEGLDGLRDRLKEYYELGARFCQMACGCYHWRGNSYCLLYFSQCPRSGALRCIMPGAGASANC